MSFSPDVVESIMISVEDAPPPDEKLKEIYAALLSEAKLDSEKSDTVTFLECAGIPRNDNSLEYMYACLLLTHDGLHQIMVDIILAQIFSSVHTTIEEADLLENSIKAIDEAGDKYLEVIGTDLEEGAKEVLMGKYAVLDDLRITLAEKAFDKFH